LVFDGVELAVYCDPPVTNVKIPVREMGRVAAIILMESIDNKARQNLQYFLDALKLGYPRLSLNQGRTYFGVAEP